MLEERQEIALADVASEQDAEEGLPSKASVSRHRASK
jgi:hypothetical protein